jgi:hypothetical protein
MKYELEKKILTCLIDNQVVNRNYDDVGEPNYCIKDDECPLATYKSLEIETGESKDFLKPVMIGLRNLQYVELVPAVDYDMYMPCGSGWMITQKGLDYAISLGIKPD